MPRHLNEARVYRNLSGPLEQDFHVCETAFNLRRENGFDEDGLL